MHNLGKYSSSMLQSLGLALTLSTGVAMEEGGGLQLKDATYEELRAYPKEDQIIAAVRCVNATILSAGRRSERVELQTSLLYSNGNLAPEQALSLMRYTQSDPIMEVGRTYLIAAYRGEWLPAWSLLEARPIEPSQAEQAVKAASVGLAKP